MISENQNYHKVTFVKSNYDPELKSYWNGLIVRFSGKDGNYFYQLIRRKRIDWNIFDVSFTNLGRFDLHFLRDVSDSESREELILFMENSCRKVKSNFPKTYAEYLVKKKGLLLEMGSRGSNHRLRVYEKKNSLEFELEIKKVAIQSYQDFLFSDNLEEFETKLVNHYYKQLKKWLVLDSCYIDWLLVGLRKLVSLERSALPSAPYIQLIQVLSFLRTLNYSRQFLDDQAYCVVEFALMDFISFTLILNSLFVFYALYLAV